MKSFGIFITICIGLATANVVKRQATPPPPTLPPMKTDMTSGAPIGTNPSTPPPPSLPTTMMTMPADPITPTAFVEPASSSGMPANPTTGMVDVMTTPQVIIDTAPPQTTQPPTPGTTKKPTIDELVSVDEILEVFGNVAKSDFFKTLPYEDQLLVMEILAGGETGKMSAILDSVELKHLLTFMYNVPFKYADPLWRVIFLGYTREEIIAQ